MNSLVARVLNGVLGYWIQDLDPSALELSMFRGEVQLGPIQLKPQAFDSLGFPVVLRQGTVGRIFLKFPWTALVSSPWTIEVGGIDVILETKDASVWDKKQEIELFYAAKQRILDQFELIPLEEINTEAGFAARMVSRVIDNLQFTLTDLRIQLYHNIAPALHYGFSLGKIAVLTCNSDWRAEFVSGEDVLNKIGVLEDLALFFAEGENEQNYVLEPMDIELKLEMNRGLQDSPKLKASLELGSPKKPISIGVRLDCIHGIEKIAAFFSLFAQFRTGAVSKEKQNPISPSEAEKYRETYIKWKQNSTETLPKLLDLERNKLSQDLIAQRKLAKAEISLSKRICEKEAVLTSLVVPKTGAVNRVKGWFSFSAPPPEEVKTAQIEAIQQEIHELKEKQNSLSLDLFSLTTGVATGETGNDSIELSLVMPQFNLALFNEKGPTLLCAMSDLHADVDYSSATIGLFLAHKEISLKQYITPDTPFPTLAQFTFLSLSYRLNKGGAHKIDFRIKGSTLVYDEGTVMYLVEIANYLTPKEMDLSIHSKEASDRAIKYIKRGRASAELDSTSSSPFRFDISINARAPRIYFPLSPTGKCLLWDLGNVKVKTTLDAGGAKYDDFQIELKESFVQLWTRALDFEKSEGTESVVSPFSVGLGIQKALPGETVQNVSLVVSTIVQPIKLSISDSLIDYVFQFFTQIQRISTHLTAGATIVSALETTAYEVGQNLQVAINERKSVTSTHLKVVLEAIVLDVKKGKELIREMEMKEVGMGMTIGENANVLGYFRLGTWIIDDPTATKPWDRLLSPRPRPPGADTESILPPDLKTLLPEKLIELHFADAKIAENAILSVHYSYESAFFSTQIFVRTDPVLLVINSAGFVRLQEFISSVIPSPEKSPDPIPGTQISALLSSGVLLESALPENSKIVRKQAHRSMVTSLFLLKVSLGTIEFCVPETPENARSKALSLAVECGAVYRLEQSETLIYDDQGVMFNRETDFKTDEGVLNLLKTRAFFGFFNEEKCEIESFTTENKDLLQPMRAHFAYSSQLQKGVNELKLEIDFEAVEMSVSYRDILSLQQISSSFLSKSAPVSSSNPVSAPSPSAKGLLKIDAKCETAFVSLVDDFDKISTPVLTAISSDFGVTMEYSLEVFRMDASGAVEIRFFNAALVVWEPLFEELLWRVHASESNEKKEEKAAVFHILTGNKIQLNLSLSMLSAFSAVFDSMQALVSVSSTSLPAPLQTERIQQLVPQQWFLFDNKLGRDIYVVLDGQTELPEVIWKLETGKSKPVAQDEIDKLRWKSMNMIKRRLGGHYYAIHLPLTITVRVSETEQTEALRIDDTGTHYFSLPDSQGLSIGALIDTRPRGQFQVITFQSLLRVVNTTPIPLKISPKQSGKSIEIEPNYSIAVPLDWTDPAESIFLCHGDEKIEIAEVKNLSLGRDMNVVVDEVYLELENTSEFLQILILSAPLYIKNALPYPITGLSDGFRIGCYPGETLKVTNVPFTETVSMWKWTADLGTKTVSTPLVPLVLGEHTYKLIGDIRTDKLSILCEDNVFPGCLDFDLSLYKQKSVLYRSRQVSLFTRFLIVNHTPFSLDIKAERAFLQIEQNSVGFTVVENPVFRTRLTGDVFGVTSEYSEKFNGSTVGLSGCLRVNQTNSLIPDTPETVQIGVMVEQANWPLSFSKVIRLYPRFVFANLSDADLVFSQVGTEQRFRVEKGKSRPYQFLKKEADQNVWISEDGENWSSSFSMLNIDSFQLQIKSNAPIPDSSHTPSLFSAHLKEFLLPPTWFKPSEERKTRFLEVQIGTNNEAVVFLTVRNPKDPLIVILNRTEQPIDVWQEDGKEKATVKAKSTIPFAFENVLSNNTKIRLSMEEASSAYNINKAKTFKTRLMDYEVSVSIQKITKVLKITVPEKDPGKKKDGILKETDPGLQIETGNRFNHCIFDIKLAGLELSLIDGVPAELLLLTIEEISVNIDRSIRQFLFKEYRHEVDIKVKSVQIDNMYRAPAEFPVLFAPRNSDSIFFQVFLSTKTIYKVQTQGSDRIETLHATQIPIFLLNIQEMVLQLHQDTLIRLIEFLSQVQDLFSRKSLMRIQSERSKEKSGFSALETLLNAETPDFSESKTGENRVFFELINLGAIKITISYRTISKKRHFIAKQDSPKLLQLLGKLVSAIVNITESALFFSSVILHRTFQSNDEMIYAVGRNYARQGALQFYKLLGASELLGNPIGLITKLGTGVFEFFNEPRKGLLINPKEFATGIGKGVRSLMSSVISGSFGSVSQVTGSLYRLLDQDSGETATGEFSKEFTGSIQTLAQGVTGLFTKPWEGAKKAGVSGFIRGVGSGLYGAATAPLAMVLRVSSNISYNISDAARVSYVSQSGRVRFPRYFGPRKWLLSYNREISQAQEYLTSSGSTENALFCVSLTSIRALLITNERLVVLERGTELQAMLFSAVRRCEVRRVRFDYLFLVVSPNDRIAVSCSRFPVLGQFYEVLMTLLEQNEQQNNKQDSYGKLIA